MKVSILVPVYGVEMFIDRCARSLFEQSYQDIQYIFVDDCSKDKSIEVLEHVINEYPNRKDNIIIVRHEVNLGLAAARNTAVDRCSTEFLFHVDSDDFLDRDVIRDCVMNAVETNADIVTVAFRRIKNGIYNYNKEEWCDDPLIMVNKLIRHQVGNGVCGRLIRTSLYKNNNIRVEVGRGMSEDLQVSPRLFYFAKKVTYISSSFYNYFLDNESSYTAKFNLQKHQDAQKALDVLVNFFCDKGDTYLDSITERRYMSVSRGIVSCARSKEGSSSFKVLKKELEELPDLNRILNLPTRIAVKINNFILLHYYVIIAESIKRMLIFNHK